MGLAPYLGDLTGNHGWKDGPWSGRHRTYQNDYYWPHTFRHRSSRKVPSAPNAGPSVLRPPPQPAFSPQSRTCRDLPRARRPLRLLVALARTALRHQPGLLGAAASFTWPQSLGPGAGRAGRGALGGAAHVESSAQSLRAPGTSGRLRPTLAGLMVGSFYQASNNDGR